MTTAQTKMTEKQKKQKMKMVEMLQGATDGVLTRYADDGKTVLNAWKDLEAAVALGYLAKEFVQTAKPGKKPVQYVMTGKGKGFLGLAANWKKKPAVVETVEDFTNYVDVTAV